MNRKRILLIDDDRAVLESMRQLLQQAGYETMTATDGYQGLTLARSWSPDLVVLDLLLPGRDGFQICESLKSDPHYAHIPIIMLTGVFITPEDVQRGLELGAERYVLKADAYVVKPPVYEQLLHDISLLLGEEMSPPVSKENLILVVDDDGLNREMLRQTLGDAGYSVVTARDGEQGWTSFLSWDPSLVLTDINMPGLSGLEVLERIREQTADVAVIMMTAFGSEEVAVQAMKQGADDYLVKPFQPWQIVAAVEENLEKARLRRLNRQLTARLRDSNARLAEQHRALQSQNTDLQEAFDRLQEAERMRRNLVSMIVHDLKNPLNVILIGMDLFATDFGNVFNRDQQDILNSTNLAGHQMLHLITNLLEVQRLGDGKMPVRFRALDLAQTLAVITRQAQPSAERKSISLHLDTPPSLPFVLADNDLVPRVVTNLLDNAIKFTPLNGEIRISSELAKGGEEVIVAVADNGPGIPAHEQTHIFEKFTQIDEAPRRGQAGAGLGLAFCKLAVDVQGGRIWVESEPGQGARFKFALPVWREEPEPGS